MKTIPLFILVFLFPRFSGFAFTKMGNDVFRSNGTVGDTQSAINAARPGATVQIPNGSYAWNSAITIDGKWIRLEGQSLEGVTITDNCNTNGIILVKESRAGNIEVSNLRLVSGAIAGPNGSYHHLRVFHTPAGKPVLLHDCYIESNGGAVAYSVEWRANQGLIWNCKFSSNYNFAGGIQFIYPDSSSWMTASTMGTADVSGTSNVYVEDCTFTGMFLGCMDLGDNSRTVIRHCTFDNSAIYSHGQDTGPDGARHWEVYDNKFIYTPSGSPPGFPKVSFPLGLQNWFTIRGGTGIIADNVFPDILYKNVAVQMNVYSINRLSNAIPCQTRYPAPRQVGQTWIGKGGYSYPNAPADGSGYATDPVYLWGNTGSGTESPTFVGLNQYAPDECGHAQKISDYVQAGRDYIIGKRKPDYTKYPYPHPLRMAVLARLNGNPSR